MIIINIYWSDLSESGQDTLINGGFVVNEAQRLDKIPIGSIHTNEDEREMPIDLLKYAEMGS